jgi:hypothetical protein
VTRFWFASYRPEGVGGGCSSRQRGEPSIISSPPLVGVPSLASVYWCIYFCVYKVPYFPAHKTHPDFFIRNFRKNNDECILILVIYWKKTGLLRMKISNHNIIYPS